MADTQAIASNRNIVVNVRSVRAVLQNHESVSEEKVKRDDR